MLDFAEKRLRRIYPAYLAVIFFCLSVGAASTTLTLPAFLTERETVRYILANAVFLNFLQPTLPSVFASNPLPILNGSLWTIKIEVMLYCCMPAIAFLFRKLGSATTAIALCAASMAWVFYFDLVYAGSAGPELARQFPGQLSYFVLGSLLSANGQLLAKARWVAIGSTPILWLVHDPLARVVINPIAYTAIVLALANTSNRHLNLGRFGDISYGIYLFHFPIIQLLIAIGVFASNAWVGLISTLALTFIAALISWHLVEKRFLRRTSHYVTCAGAAN